MSTIRGSRAVGRLVVWAQGKPIYGIGGFAPTQQLVAVGARFYTTADSDNTSQTVTIKETGTNGMNGL